MNLCRHHLHYKSVGAPRVRKEADAKWLAQFEPEVRLRSFQFNVCELPLAFVSPFSGEFHVGKRIVTVGSPEMIK